MHLKHLSLIGKAAVILFLGGLTVVAGNYQMKTPGVVPPDAKVFGKSMGEWQAAWWQWATSIPVDWSVEWDHPELSENPLLDPTGAQAGNGQKGPVWFLAGVINVSGSAERWIEVPYGKALFFPVINTECSTLEVGTIWYGADEAALRACADGFADAITAPYCRIDGMAVENLGAYRTQSPLFKLVIPENNVLGASVTRGYSVSDGIHLMVAPLPLGEHTIEFGGTTGDFTLHIIYHLVVVPMNQYVR